MKRGCFSSNLVNDFVDGAEIMKNVKLLHRERSAFQEIRVYDTYAMGRILMLDGAVQIATDSLGENDHYTIDLTRLALGDDFDKEYQHVIIIGGGDLPVAAHVLAKYPGVKKVTVCEIDKRVIEVTKKFYSHGQSCIPFIESGRLEIVVASGAEYLERLVAQGKQNSVGGLIVDCTGMSQP